MVLSPGVISGKELERWIKSNKKKRGKGKLIPLCYYFLRSVSKFFSDTGSHRIASGLHISRTFVLPSDLSSAFDSCLFHPNLLRSQCGECWSCFEEHHIALRREPASFAMYEENPAKALRSMSHFYVTLIRQFVFAM
jgi:hypothetical protein